MDQKTLKKTFVLSLLWLGISLLSVQTLLKENSRLSALLLASWLLQVLWQKRYTRKQNAAFFFLFQNRISVQYQRLLMFYLQIAVQNTILMAFLLKEELHQQFQWFALFSLLVLFLAFFWLYCRSMQE